MSNEQNKTDDFYVGYLSEASTKTARFVKKIIFQLFLLAMVLAFVFVSNQERFSGGIFEFGNLTTLEGTLVKKPIPILLIEDGGVSQSVVLLGFGKYGAEQTIAQMEADQGVNLEGQKLKLEGTLIYHDGMTLLELTNGRSALMEHTGTSSSSMAQFNELKLGSTSMVGEIIDPKCYFGVMKPGHGKSHRSCAIRCISGGVPPMLKVVDEAGNSNYFVLLGREGQAINQQVLDYVADAVELKAHLYSWQDLYLLKLDPDKDIRRKL